MLEIVKIPKERLGVLIGENGKTKKQIEKETKAKISIERDVQIEGDDECVIKATEIVRAIGRGFSPKNALLLLRKGCELCVINLRGESEKTIKRLFGRVIGRRGSTRRRLEEDTGVKISVYGKTISIIGDFDCVEEAKKFIEMLLEGRSHGYVYKAMEEGEK